MTAESRSTVPGRRILSAKEAAPIKRDLRKAEAEYRLLDREWESLLRDHEGQWVAVNGVEVIFADSLESLIEAARAKHWPLGTIAVDQLIARRPAVLL
jgi:hypothetical protein